MHVQMHISIHVYIHIHVCEYVCVRGSVCVSACVCLYTCQICLASLFGVQCVFHRMLLKKTRKHAKPNHAKTESTLPYVLQIRLLPDQAACLIYFRGMPNVKHQTESTDIDRPSDGST